MPKYKRKGCGPRRLGSALKMIVEPGRMYKDVRIGGYGFDNKEFEDKNKFHRFHTFDKVDTDAPENKGKKLRDMSVEKKGPGSFAVPTVSQHNYNVNINKQLDEDIVVPYERGTDPAYILKQRTGSRSKPKQPNKQKIPTVEKPKTSGKAVKASNIVAYGGTKTWLQGSKAAMASTGKSLNQLVAARKGLKKGSAEYNTIQNQINAALGSKVRHSTPAKKKGCSKKRK